METLALIFHVMISITMIIAIILQNLDVSGALGIGNTNIGSGGVRVDMPTKLTAWLGVLFFCTSLGIAMLSGGNQSLIPPAPPSVPQVPLPGISSSGEEGSSS